MRAVIQKVTHAEVDVLNGNTRETAGRISDGLTVLLGVGTEDTEADARYIADKIAAHVANLDILSHRKNTNSALI